jgi:hypothetical protein
LLKEILRSKISLLVKNMIKFYYLSMTENKNKNNKSFTSLEEERILEN